MANLEPSQSTLPTAPAGAVSRDKMIDGYRAVAVICVIYAHATAYRFADIGWLHYPQKLAGPLAEVGVQLFFVISGFIITSLLIREESKTNSVDIFAFYIRRTFRIIPPFAVMVAISPASWASKAHSLMFTCNIFECEWGVAHSWSLAVEEQFYLLWPLLFLLLKKYRTLFLLSTIAALIITYLMLPPTFHGNSASFAHIAIGALLAVQPNWRISGRYWAWLLTVAILAIGPLTPFGHWLAALNPFFIAYLLFGTRQLSAIRIILESRPFKSIGVASYSLYLWQQPFLGKESAWPLWLLPVVVATSVVFIERPFIRLGHKFSTGLKTRYRLNPKRV